MTPERTHYSKAPIVEAIIDLRIARQSGPLIEDLAAIRDIVADRYPNQEILYEYSEEVYIEEVGDPAYQETTREQLGFRFASWDGRENFNARLDGFSFTIRAPYDRWEPFRDEARRLWDLYRSVVKAEAVTRAAMRYVNRLDLDGATVKLEDYLRTHPEVSTDLPNEGLLSGFFMQLQLWQEDLSCMLIVNEAPSPSPTPGTVSILLDFDLYREQFAWNAEDDEAIWDFMEQLHDRKNEVFEACITDETRRLIK